MTRTVGLIWAQGRNRVIGSAGTLPWHLPEDLRHFRDVTRGHTVLMGRSTWDSLPRKPLPGRRNLVLTRNPSWAAAGAEAYQTLEAALDAAVDGPVWVIGGGQLYTAALPAADLVVVTDIDLEPAGDTVAPRLDPDTWAAQGPGEWLTSETGVRYRIRTLRRRAG